MSVRARPEARRGGRSPRGRCAPALAPLLVPLLVLAGCSVPGAHGGSVAPTQPATAVQVCPGGSRSMDVRASAVIVTPKTPNRTASVRVGQAVVIELPATLRWAYGGLTGASRALAESQPSAALDSAINVCLWTWKAQAKGSAIVRFTGGPNCQPTAPCPETAGQTAAPRAAGGDPVLLLTGTASPSNLVLVTFTINVS